VSAGKTLYVDIEGGIGDQIVNIRFLDILTSYGMNPILVSQNTNYYTDINGVFRRHGYQVITDTFLIDRTQSWVSMMSLPGYLGLTESQLWTKPYLTPLRNSKNTLDGTRPKIGIKCSGNPFFAQDEYRSMTERRTFFNNIELNHLFSESGPSGYETIYGPTKDRSYSISTVLPGYISDQMLQWNSATFKERVIDVGYRGRRLPVWMGDVSNLKSGIVELIQREIYAKKILQNET
jgi:hypothetical protein